MTDTAFLAFLDADSAACDSGGAARRRMRPSDVRSPRADRHGKRSYRKRVRRGGAARFSALRRLHQVDDALGGQRHSSTRTPKGASASSTAAARAAGAIMRPPSPPPLTPYSVKGDGVSTWPISKARHLQRGGQEVVHEAAGQRLALGVVGALLVEGHADALGDAAGDLAAEALRIDDGAHVVDGDVAQERAPGRSRARPRRRGCGRRGP